MYVCPQNSTISTLKDGRVYGTRNEIGTYGLKLRLRPLHATIMMVYMSPNSTKCCPLVTRCLKAQRCHQQMFNNMLDIFISAQRANPFTFIKIDEGRNLRLPLKKLKQEF